ncbi:MAG: tetratricopeptide repeat protein [Bacteroidia bacterium]|nr:tetratricopeptide repeat protein [Bacteroidia bacterium]
MKHKYFYYFAILILLASSCKKISSHDEIRKIEEMEANVNEARLSPGPRDLEPFRALAEAYVTFVDKYPEAPESPDYLFKAGELYSQELGQLDRSIELFSRNYEQYPNHETASHALFLKAYLYNNTLKDLVNAEKTYREFLRKYPDHELARSAQFELDQLGIPDDELLRRLQSGNLADTTAKQNP